jgi:hypothetical protein
MEDWFEYLKKIPNWIKASVLFFTALLSFSITVKENFYLASLLIYTVIFVTVWLICIYVSFAKTKPLVEGGKGVYRFPTLRFWGLAGIVMVPFVAISTSFISPFNSYFKDAIIYLSMPTSTPIGPILANDPYPAPTALARPSTQVVAAATAGEYQSRETQARLAFEDYAWLDFPFWPVTVGAPTGFGSGGELGDAPWIAVEIRLVNPSDKESQTLSEITLHTNSFEPVTSDTDYTLKVASENAPFYLIPTDCDQGNVTNNGYTELANEGRFLGVLSTDSAHDSKMRQSGNSAPVMIIEPNGMQDYVLLISAKESGKYEFTLLISFTASDFVKSEISRSFEYAFLDYATALDLPKDNLGTKCP